MSAVRNDDGVTAFFSNTVAYHHAAQWRALSRSPFRMAYLFLWALWIAWFVAFLLGLRPQRLLTPGILQHLLVLLAGVVIVFNITPAVHVRRSQPVERLVDVPVTWSFTADRVAGTVGEWEHREFAWEILSSVDVLPDGFFVVPNRYISHWIPRTAFGSDASYERALRWAEDGATTLRRYSGGRVAEWIASLVLVPLALSLFPAAAALCLPEIALPGDLPVVETTYARATLHYAIGYWLIALAGFLLLGRSAWRSGWLYAGVALAFGLAWEWLWRLSLTAGAGSTLVLIAATAAWPIGGWLHWWLVVGGPARHQ